MPVCAIPKLLVHSRGAILIIVLIFLLLMSLMSFTAMESLQLHSKMQQAVWEQEVIFYKEKKL